MRNKKYFITGPLAIMAFMLLSPQTKAADICYPDNIDTQYKAIYCDIQQDDSEEFDEDLIEILANQFGLSEDNIKEVLDGTVCDTFSELTEDEKVKMPTAIQDACIPSGKSTEQILGGWSVLSDIKNTYQKEKVIQQSSKALTFKFKTSEQYWDGQIGPGPDAPFDLIVDLNLIEIVLFGSKATWMSDVFTFPQDEEEDGDGGETPLDELVPEDTPPEETTSPEDTGDPGLTVTEEGGGEEGLPPDCVLPDDPEADNGNGPGSSYENPLCGNGTVEILLAEQCDDGNADSGDGCNQYCQTEATGSNDQCIDPDAVTFKKPEDTKGSGSGSSSQTGGTTNENGNDNQSECPEGSVPRKGSGISGQEAGPPKEIPQSPEYPGPYLGGTLKQFPAGNKPRCPEGYSEAKTEGGGASASATGDETLGINVGGEQYDIPRCLPTTFCADFKEAQDFLFGDGWEDDDNLVNIAPSIEALFCVNITKENRPLSRYNLNEGCVDCHIIAMVDAVEKALQTNVSPLKNTTNAFGISSPHGPNFSFNLNTATKTKLKFNHTGTAANAIKKAEESYAEFRNTASLAVNPTANPLANLKNSVIQDENDDEAILENIRLSGLSNAVISDQEVGGRIKPLLEQMKESFSRIQSVYEAIIGSTALDKKEQCK